MISPIPTRDSTGKPNGFVLPIWNATETDYRPQQIYMTSVLPGQQKGPHLHCKRRGQFLCVRGDVMIVTRGCDGAYQRHFSGELGGFNVIDVPPGTPACIYNMGSIEALVLNMPTPAWTKEDQDEWPVTEWKP